MRNIHVILLAAGNSWRFAGNKLLYPYRGKPIYKYMVEAVDEAFAGRKEKTAQTQAWTWGKKILVTQYEKIRLDGLSHGYTAVRNECPEAGISHSIRLGLLELRRSGGCEPGDAAMFCVCDQPHLTAGTLVRFAKAYAQSGRGIGCLQYGGIPGNPMIFRDAYWEELQGLTGDQGGKALRSRYPEAVLYVDAAQAGELLDIDDRDALARMERTTPVIVRGGGDLATGTIHRLHREGYRVLVLETRRPACIRRQVAVCEAVYERKTQVEGMTAVLVSDRGEMEAAWESGAVPVVVDPSGEWIRRLRPEVVIDAILAKQNLGTKRAMAPLTIGLGPGFTAGNDVDFVIETMRGESLGRIYPKGSAIPNTGIPGEIAGYSKERVIHAPACGIFEPVKQIGDRVKPQELLAWIRAEEERTAVRATIPGFLRGMIRQGYPVKQGLKIMDIEPRLEDVDICFHISDKARCIADSVYQVIKKYEDNKRDGQRL